ncbi:MAG: Flp family type IVb pilin [Bryobacteraceae bacterium]
MGKKHPEEWPLMTLQWFTGKLFPLTRLWGDRRGQDMIEYALLAGFVVIAVAAVLPPTIMPAVSTIFSKIVNLFQQVS